MSFERQIHQAVFLPQQKMQDKGYYVFLDDWRGFAIFFGMEGTAYRLEALSVATL